MVRMCEWCSDDDARWIDVLCAYVCAGCERKIAQYFAAQSNSAAMLSAMRSEELMEKCAAYADTQPYCWFRTSYAKIGHVEPRWIVWFETSSKSWSALQDGCSAPTLIEALDKLIAITEMP